LVDCDNMRSEERCEYSKPFTFWSRDGQVQD
jgi:hypothetical protein